MKKILPRQPIIQKLRDFNKRINEDLSFQQWTLYYSDIEIIHFTYESGEFYLTGMIKDGHDVYRFYYNLTNSVAGLETYYIIMGRLEESIDNSPIRYNFPEKSDLNEFIQLLRELYCEPLTKRSLS